MIVVQDLSVQDQITWLFKNLYTKYQGQTMKFLYNRYL